MKKGFTLEPGFGKAAFTLAEVLITLAIIGIVAAITIPSIVTSYKKMVAKNQLKKTISVLTNAYNSALQEYGGDMICVGSFPGGVDHSAKFAVCKDFWMNYFFKKLSIVKFCDKNAFANGCVPDYSDEDFPYGAGCGGFTAPQMKEKQPAAILADGTIVFPYGWNRDLFPEIGFDINGFKGPNKGGYDVFSLTVGKKGNVPALGASGNGDLGRCLPMSPGTYFRRISDLYK